MEQRELNSLNMAHRQYDPRYSLIRTTKPETGKSQETSQGGTSQGAPNSLEKRPNPADMLASRNTENPSPASTKQETGKPQETSNQRSGGGTSKGAPNSHEKRYNLADVLTSRNTEHPLSQRLVDLKDQVMDRVEEEQAKGTSNSDEQRSTLAKMLGHGYTQKIKAKP